MLGCGNMGTGLPGFEEAGKAVGFVAVDSMERLTLDIVVVVLAIGVDTEVGVLDRMDVSGMTPTLGFEFVESVGGVWIGAKEGLECRRQLGR
jgi:hypothetical protein